MVPDPLNAQAWNRYSYVINNPLAFTDPNGYCFLGMCSWGKAISTFFGRTFGVLFREFPILGNLLEIAAVALCWGNPVCAVPVAFATTTFVAGVTSGNLGYALKAGFIAAATAVAFYEVGEITSHMPGAIPGVDGPHGTFEPFSEAHLANIAGHAAVGCASAAASGGKCGPAALAGGITSAAGPFINGKNFALNVTANAVLGGVASVAGGGKFANGAITGAFGYLFNAAGGRAFGHVVGWIIGGVGGIETGPGDIFVALALGHVLGEAFSNLEDSVYNGMASGLGDLKVGEVNAIQSVVDEAGRPLDVVGSAARGERTATSDIDYTTANANYDYFEGLQKGLPSIDPEHGLLRGYPDGPSIRFEPGRQPFFVPGGR
jgi:hypothetical protein